MIKYLSTQGANYYLEKLLKNATSRITLISPYIQLQRRIKELLKEKKQNGVKICIVCRKNNLKENLTDYASNVFDVPTLHAKCYMNENEAIITSLNLYEFSQQNNEEMGVYIKNEGIGVELYSEILSDANRLCNINSTSDTEAPSKTTLIKGTKYSAEQLDAIFDFDYKGPAGIKKSKSGDMVLFSNSAATKYQDTETGDVINYHGQNTGQGEQKLIYGNKDLYGAYENKDINIHLFKNSVYSGEYFIAKEPYLENGKWVFPLATK